MITKKPHNILIADDSLFFRIKLSDVLVEAGHRIRLVQDGREAMEEIEAGLDDIDLLILDLQMPHMDGFGILNWLRERGYEDKFPVLIVTGVYESATTIRDLKALGAKGFMSKDISPEEVVRRVHVLLFASKAREGVKRKRVSAFIPVDYSVGDIKNTGMALNISDGGMFLQSDVELPDGAIVDLRFALPASNRVMDARGVVRWMPEESRKKSIFYGYGIMFAVISGPDRRAIHDFVEKADAANHEWVVED